MLSLIFDGIKTVIGWTREKAKAKHDRTMAALELDKRLLLSKQEANSQWEISQIKDKDKVLRWAAFVLFASPLLASLINPDFGNRVQQAWHSLPDWQANVLSGICLAVFGMKKIPQIMGSITGSITQALKNK